MRAVIPRRTPPTVTGNRGGITGGTVSSFGDHRIAMSAAIAATACKASVYITPFIPPAIT